MPGAFTLKGVELAQLARPAQAATAATFIAALSESAATPHAEVHTLGRKRFRNPRDFAFIDPGLITVRPDVPAAPGYDRAAATLPVADVQNPGDNIAFFAADGSATYYLPRYRLKQVAADRYDISMTGAAAGGFRLAVGLDRVPPPELAALAGAMELPHEVIALVAFTTAAGLAKQVPLTELILDESDKVCGAAARVMLPERDALMTALQSPASGVRLLVRRAIKVSAQLPAAGGNPLPPTQLIMADVARPHLLAQLKVNPAIWSSVATAHISALPGAVSADAATPPPPASAPRYHDLDLVLEQAAEPDPLVLDPILHGYFYQGGPRAASAGTLKRISIPYADGATERHLPYFQDPEDPTLFYYLPDAFRLGRQDREPFVPEMEIRILAPEGSLARARVIIGYTARPFTLPGRLKAALPTLAAAIPPTASAGATPRLEPMPALAKLRLAVPRAAAVEMRAFDEVTVDVANGFRHNLDLEMDEFRQLFASAFSTDATSLFTGEVLVNTGRPNPEMVPVEIRFTNTEGPLFDTLETPEADGATKVRFRNGTESPLRIRKLPVRLMREGAFVEGLVEGLDLTQPVEVQPGQSLEFRVSPATELAGEGPADAVFDLGEVDILAKPDLVLPVVSDTSVPAEYVRAIEVMTLPELMDADSPDGPILLINVEFRTGGAVRLSKEAQTAVAAVKLPLVNLLLGQDAQGSYDFRQQVIRRAGQTVDRDWRNADYGVLVVPVTP